MKIRYLALLSCITLLSSFTVSAVDTNTTIMQQKPTAAIAMPVATPAPAGNNMAGMISQMQTMKMQMMGQKMMMMGVYMKLFADNLSRSVVPTQKAQGQRLMMLADQLFNEGNMLHPTPVTMPMHKEHGGCPMCEMKQ